MKKTQDVELVLKEEFPYNLKDEDIERIKKSVKIVEYEDMEITEKRKIIELYIKHPKDSYDMAVLFQYAYYQLNRLRRIEDIRKGLEELERKTDVDEMDREIEKYSKMYDKKFPRRKLAGILGGNRLQIMGVIDFVFELVLEKKKGEATGEREEVEDLLKGFREGKKYEVSEKSGAKKV